MMRDFWVCLKIFYFRYLASLLWNRWWQFALDAGCMVGYFTFLKHPWVAVEFFWAVRFTVISWLLLFMEFNLFFRVKVYLYCSAAVVYWLATLCRQHVVVSATVGGEVQRFELPRVW